MPSMFLEITNLPQLRQAFSMAPVLMNRRLNETIEKSIYMVERDSKINTPVDTGTLRRSHYEIFRTLYGEVGTNTQYDIYVHEGTKNMRARPYLRDAMEKNLMQINRFFTDAVQSVLNSVGRMT